MRQQERAQETDEERARRQERLERDRPEPVVGTRLGIRVETGAWLSGLGETGNFVLSPGLVLAHPVGRSFELVGAASLMLGGGGFFTWGPSLEFGAQGVLAGGFHGGAGIHLAIWQVVYEYEEWSSSYRVWQQTGNYVHVHGSLFGGVFLDRLRRFDVGLLVRAGADAVEGDFSGCATLYFAHLWSL